MYHSLYLILSSTLFMDQRIRNIYGSFIERIFLSIGKTELRAYAIPISGTL